MKAEGTDLEKIRTEQCSQQIMAARLAYIQRTKQELKKLKGHSKTWWKQTNTLLGAPAKTCSIPALKNNENVWILNESEKATLIAETQKNKCVLPVEVINEYSAIEPTESRQDSLQLPTEEMAYAELIDVKEDSATGPDLLPALILKKCARWLAKPVALLVMRIIMLGTWPDTWRNHWIIQIF